MGRGRIAGLVPVVMARRAAVTAALLWVPACVSVVLRLKSGGGGWRSSCWMVGKRRGRGEGRMRLSNWLLPRSNWSR